ncbi:LysR family transcriptional regulator [Streptomyces sp. NRRL B-1347]|uniref:LysR family transcriptional regulator n=1 Tax=Streptomyces sp. NRRL B-1347 TaxID=1476877 RepID=UPI0004CA39AB|nr:LysR family transcriptional regulator [Streptomyces sp. NRRL B-1347]
MYDLRRLRLLRELKHRGTLAAVAAALSYSPSSVSQQLAQLEAEAGVPLLEPVGRRVRLTAQAEILVAHTEALLERMERAEADIAASLTELTGTLRVAAFQTAALALVPAALTSLRAAHPRLRVHVTQLEPEAALPALLARDFDLVVAEEYPGGAGPRSDVLERQELCRDPLRLAVPGPAGEPDPDPRSLSGHPWVMEPEGTAARRWATTVCREAGFEPDVRYESADLLVHLRLAERGLAAAFLPDLVWGAGPRSVAPATPTVALRDLPPGLGARRIFTVVRRGGGGRPAVTAARQALREAARMAVAPLLP